MTVRVTISIEQGVADDIELLAQDEFKRNRAFSMYANRVLVDHCQTNRTKIQQLKKSKNSKRNVS